MVSSEVLSAGETSVLWHGQGNIHQLDLEGDEDARIFDIIVNDYDFVNRKMSIFAVNENGEMAVTDVLG